MRVAVFGMGHMGARHARNLSALGHTVLPYDPAKAYTEYPRDFEAVVVATPPDVRPTFDVPTFYEKPLGLTAAHARRIVGVGAVGYNWRFDQRVGRLRDDVLSGKNGRTLSARFEFGFDLSQWWPETKAEDTPYAKTGVLLEASHELDLVRWFFGDATVCGGWVGNRRWKIPAEDTAIAVLDASGLPVEVHLDMTKPYYWRYVHVTFEQRTDSADLDREHVDETYRAEITAFMRWVETGERDERLASIADGVAALELADSIRAAGNQALSETEGGFAAMTGYRS